MRAYKNLAAENSAAKPLEQNEEAAKLEASSHFPAGSEGRAHLNDFDSGDHSPKAEAYPDHARSSLSCLS